MRPFYPLMFHPEAEPQKCRRSVVRWVETIAEVAEKGEGSVYQNHLCNSCTTTLRSWTPFSTAIHCDFHQAQGNIDYKQDDRITAVRQIVVLAEWTHQLLLLID